MQQETIEGYRLSSGQAQLWRVQLGLGAQFYHQCAVVVAHRSEPERVAERLEEAWRLTQSRHEVLRTALRRLPGMELPLQVVLPEPTAKLVISDLRGGEAAGQAAQRVSEAMDEERWQGFDFEAGRVAHARLLRLDERKHVLVLTVSALAADARSLGNILKDISLCSAADAAGEFPEDEPVQYVQFSEWQHELLEGDEAAEGKAFWHKYHSIRREPLQLPHELSTNDHLQAGHGTGSASAATGTENAAASTPAFSQLEIELDEGLKARLESVAHAQDATLSEMLLAAWQILLWRASGQSEFEFWCSFDGRKFEETHDAIGPYAQLLPLANRFEAHTPFNQIIRQLRKTMHAAAIWQECYDNQAATQFDSFESLTTGADPADTSSPAFIRGIGFEYAELDPGHAAASPAVSSSAAPGIVFELADVRSNYPSSPLLLSVLAARSLPMRLRLRFDRTRFTSEGATRLLDALLALLSAAIDAPHSPARDLPAIGAIERERLVRAHNQAAAPFDAQICVHTLFERQAALSPEAEAVVSGEQRLTFAELNARSNQLARHLRTLGVGPEVLVALCLERSAEMVVAILATLKAGGAYVPIDPAYPAERIAFMLADSGARVVLSERKLVAGLPEHGAQVFLVDAQREELSEYATDDVGETARPENLAYVIYTSGSTGRPKGVGVEHRQLAHLDAALSHSVYSALGTGHAEAPGEEHKERLRVAVNAPFSFDASVKQWLQLLAGHCLVVLPEEVRADPVRLVRELVEQRVEVFDSTPSHLRVLLDEGLGQGGRLRAVLLGGEAISQGLWSSLEAGDGGAAVRYFNLYGPTECTVDTSWAEVGGVGGASGAVIGRGLGNVRLYVLDEWGALAPEGGRGELYVGGAGVARGYLGRAGLTAERFVPDEFSGEAGARLYRTGDVVRWRGDGELEFIGRVDGQVKVRGYRIEVGEIEAVLSSHPQVGGVAVVVRAVDEEAEGEESVGGMRLVAYVARAAGGAGIAQSVNGGSSSGEAATGGEAGDESMVEGAESAGGRTLEAGALRQYAATRLPEYMVPSRFVLLDALPLTRHGKVDRQALPEEDEAGGGAGVEYEAPRAGVEEVVAEVFARVLKVERIGRGDNFFEVGGHSLLATQAVSRLREACGVEVALRSLFEHPTVEELAREVEVALRGEGDGAEAVPPLAPVSREGELPLSFAQQRLWFLDQLEPDSAFYNIGKAVRLGGELDAEALGRALAEVVRRHEALRTTFPIVEGQPVQRVHEAGAFELPVVDLRSIPERESEGRRLAGEESARPFDLAAGPLWRVRLLRLAEQEHVLVLVLHHIVSDGWSMGLLVREVTALYGAYARGEASPLAELVIQYADYAVWQRGWLQGERLERELAYWRGQLGGGSAALELPTDRPRPAMQTFKGSYKTFSVPEEVAVSLRSLSQQQGCTLYMTLLAAINVLLYRHSGQEDITVGTPVAGRNRAEVEPLIGFFVNTLVLRTDMSGEPSFIELMKRVREVCLGAYAHQDVPFEKLVEELQPERDPSRSPLFQVMFSFESAHVAPAGPAKEVTGLRVAQMGSGIGATAKFDLSASLTDTGAGLVGALEYNTDLFDEQTVVRMAEHLRAVLAAAAAAPADSVGGFNLLSEAERQEILGHWSGLDAAAAAAVPARASVHALFERQAAATPQAVAVAFGDHLLTYGELNARANSLARHLRTMGVGAEELVGVCVERSMEMVVSILATLKAGGAYVPLDPAYPAERIAFMLEDSGARVLLTQRSLLDAVHTGNAPVVVLDDADVVAELASQATGNLSVEVEAQNLAYLIYTSGSTGRPKAVAVPHAGVVRLVSPPSYAQLGADDVALQLAPLAFDASTFEIWGALLNGARLAVMEPGRYSLAELGAALGRHRVTTLWLTAGLFHLMAGERPEELSGVRQLLAGGDVLSPARVREYLRTAARGSVLINGYGPTENTTFTCCHRMEAGGAGVAGVENGEGWRQEWASVPIGRPIGGTWVYVLDERLRPAPAGVAGELYAGGAGVARGYLGRAGLTAERFVPDEFSGEAGARLYRTGDVVRWRAGGELEFIGRVDGQVKVRGYRIEVGEVEAVLMQHARVGECVVAAVGRGGSEDERQLIAYVVGEAAEAGQLATEVREYAAARLPGYMAPSEVIVLEALPLTENGKVDRRALPKVKGLDTSRGAGAAYEAPRNELEEKVAEIWLELLAVERVGVNDNFFDLGGHSLLATQVISRVLQLFNVEVPLRNLFEEPTVASLSAEIKKAQNDGDSAPRPTPITRVSREARKVKLESLKKD